MNPTEVKAGLLVTSKPSSEDVKEQMGLLIKAIKSSRQGCDQGLDKDGFPSRSDGSLQKIKESRVIFNNLEDFSMVSFEFAKLRWHLNVIRCL